MAHFFSSTFYGTAHRCAVCIGVSVKATTTTRRMRVVAQFILLFLLRTSNSWGQSTTDCYDVQGRASGTL